MNNAIEHSKGSNIRCRIAQDYLYTEISIVDDGVGIFRNIQEYFAKELGQKIDYQDAILELHKGKFTTSSATHSGEGVFFTTKMLQNFAIWSDAAIFSTGCMEKDEFVKSHLITYYTKINHIGTMVLMRLENQVTRSPKEVFDMYAPIEDGFVKTYIPLKEVLSLIHI